MAQLSKNAKHSIETSTGRPCAIDIPSYVVLADVRAPFRRENPAYCAHKPHRDFMEIHRKFLETLSEITRLLGRIPNSRVVHGRGRAARTNLLNSRSKPFRVFTPQLVKSIEELPCLVRSPSHIFNTHVAGVISLSEYGRRRSRRS